MGKSRFITSKASARAATPVLGWLPTTPILTSHGCSGSQSRFPKRKVDYAKKRLLEIPQAASRLRNLGSGQNLDLSCLWLRIRVCHAPSLFLNHTFMKSAEFSCVFPSTIMRISSSAFTKFSALPTGNCPTVGADRPLKFQGCCLLSSKAEDAICGPQTHEAG